MDWREGARRDLLRFVTRNDLVIGIVVFDTENDRKILCAGLWTITKG